MQTQWKWEKEKDPPEEAAQLRRITMRCTRVLEYYLKYSAIMPVPCPNRLVCPAFDDVR